MHRLVKIKNNLNIKNFFIIICFFSFIYLWDVKIFNFKYLIFFPFIFILIEFFKNQIKKNELIFILLIILFFAFHFFLVFLSNKILPIKFDYYIFPFLIIMSIVIRYKDLIKRNFDFLNMIFIILFNLFFCISLYFLKINLLVSDDNLNIDNLFFSCSNGLISYTKLLFNENSHMAMMSVPVIFSFLVNIPKNFLKLIFFIFFLFFNFINYSATFLFGIIVSSILIIFYLLIKKKFYKIINITIILILSFISMYLDSSCNKKISETFQSLIINYKQYPKYDKVKVIETASEKKINLSSSEKKINLSSEVFSSKLSASLLSLKDNYYIGVGFNNFYLVNDHYLKKLQLGYTQVYELNKYDASSNFIKIISEFGIFSLIFVLIFIAYFFYSSDSVEFAVFSIALIATQLIRGGGYFNGGFIIISTIIIFSVYEDLKKFKSL